MNLQCDLAMLFDMPLVIFDSQLKIIDMNEAFQQRFAAVEGQGLDALADDFNARKFERRTQKGQAYICQISNPHAEDEIYQLTVRPYQDGFIALAADASARAKADAMIASYSQMMENKMASLTRENEKLQKYLSFYKSANSAGDMTQ